MCSFPRQQSRRVSHLSIGEPGCSAAGVLPLVVLDHSDGGLVFVHVLRAEEGERAGKGRSALPAPLPSTPLGLGYLPSLPSPTFISPHLIHVHFRIFRGRGGHHVWCRAEPPASIPSATRAASFASICEGSRAQKKTQGGPVTSSLPPEPPERGR